jgi:hypothetical protein
MFGESLKEDNMSHSLKVNNGNGEQRKAKISQHGPSPRFEPLAQSLTGDGFLAVIL